jgi:hypothetical protein
MKSIIRKTLPFLLVSSSAFSLTDGFYVGAGVGAVDVISKFTVTDIDVGEYNVFTSQQGNTGFTGVIEGGYNYIWDCFALGFQADARFSSASVDFSIYNADVLNGTNTITVNLDNKNSYGLNIRPAYLFNDSVSTFLVLGYRRTSFDFTVTDSGSLQPTFTYTRSFDADGIEYGIGTEIALNDQLGLRLEVTQTGYQSENLFSVANQGSATAKTTVNQGLISLVWYPVIA